MPVLISVAALDPVINDVKPVEWIEHPEDGSPEHVELHEAQAVVSISADGIVAELKELERDLLGDCGDAEDHISHIHDKVVSQEEYGQ